MWDDYLDYDYDEPIPTCEECGCRMKRDWEGDPAVINGTRDFWTCPECGKSWDDPESPVNVTEVLFDFARKNGLMPD